MSATPEELARARGCVLDAVAAGHAFKLLEWLADDLSEREAMPSKWTLTAR